MAARINPPSARGYQQMVEPAERLARMLAGRWTLAVLGELSKGGRRYKISTMRSGMSRTRCSPTSCDEPNAMDWSLATSTTGGSRPPPSIS
jgi:hypothetical protein